MHNFSIVIPVYNRPDELGELLESLVVQTVHSFEVIIVEDGSEESSEDVAGSFKDKLNIIYLKKKNEGPGPARNFGAGKANGEYLIFFDSDCIIPSDYFEGLQDELANNYTDAYGGPDSAHSSFTPVQKAINYSMTSFITTGGIRGGKRKLDKFYPRSFNMGYSKEVFLKTGGFAPMRFGEDIDMSIRILKNGFGTRLIPGAYVYHKRRTNLRKFFKQVYNSGIARINLYKRHPESLKLVHFFPSLFFLGLLALVLLSAFCTCFLWPILALIIVIFLDSSSSNRSVYIALLSIMTTFIQLSGYGIGFIEAFWKRIILGKGEFNAFVKNFYK